jgi:long-chain acyl-CoA synthetase
VLITLDALTPMVQKVRTQTTIEQIIVTSLAEYSAAAAPPPRIASTLALADLVSDTRRTPVRLPTLTADDLAVLQYTGGTTGTPKGAMLTHGNIFANVVQTIAWTNPMYLYGGEERYLVVIPYFHIYAFSVCMMMGLWIGALQIIHPKYEPDAVLASIKRFRPTYFPAVPTVFVSLLNHPKVLEHGLDQVRQFNSGGAPCPVEVLEQWERTIGRPLYEGYGLSETSPVTHTTPQLARRRMGSIGLPVPDTDMKIVDVEHGTREMPLGEAGEICIAGPQVMKGYWNKPEESAGVLRADATGRIWFHTGDIGTMDADGFANIVQRKKDMIIVDGFNVYPSEVEAVLYSHPAVRLAAVIGVPDTYHGETVKACIAFKPGTTATADEIIAFCRGSLTDYKVPRAIEVRETLPMSAVGKILYRVLRDEHASAGAAQS